ncbi:MAG: hypothetical protein C0501_23245 [Isosphaera sp.]|nr:hypothetical protein [Isosphaera sp.]
MSKKSRGSGGRPFRPEPSPGRRWAARAALIAAAVGLVLAVCVLVCMSIVRNAARPPDAPGGDQHDHPPGPHGGTIVAVGRENRFHAEAVFERSGAVRLYTYGEDESRVFAAEAQPITATVRRHGDKAEFTVHLAPEPQPGDPPGKASRYVGRLPKEATGGRLELVVPSMVIAGDRYWFTVPSGREWHPDPMPAKVTEEAERTLYLTPGGKYTADDIRANGGVTASEKFKGAQAEHDAKPKPGDRICPVSLTKANPKFAWVIGGKEYQFCCPPCVDEFVRKAKEKPDEVKPPESYVQPP